MRKGGEEPQYDKLGGGQKTWKRNPLLLGGLQGGRGLHDVEVNVVCLFTWFLVFCLVFFFFFFLFFFFFATGQGWALELRGAGVTLGNQGQVRSGEGWLAGWRGRTAG